MRPDDYARWLAAGPAVPSLAQYGFALFRKLGCSGCHDAASTVHAPLLQGLPFLSLPGDQLLLLPLVLFVLGGIS